MMKFIWNWCCLSRGENIFLCHLKSKEAQDMNILFKVTIFFFLRNLYISDLKDRIVLMTCWIPSFIDLCQIWQSLSLQNVSHWRGRSFVIWISMRASVFAVLKWHCIIIMVIWYYFNVYNMRSRSVMFHASSHFYNWAFDLVQSSSTNLSQLNIQGNWKQ